MKLLITGAGGMLGSDLVKVFDPHFDCLGVSRHRPSHLSIPYQQCDLTHNGPFEKICRDFQPDLLIHCAAMTQVDLCESEREAALAGNYDVTRTAVAGANAARCRLIFFSTDYVFNGERDQTYPEDAPVNPLNYYGETKLLAENYILSHAAQFLIFRVSWLFGIHNNSFPETILKLAKKQTELSIVGDQIGRPTYTKDVAMFLYKVFMEKSLNNLDNNVFHLANQHSVSWAEYAEYVLKRTGKNNRVARITSDQLNRPAKRPKHAVLSTDKLVRIFGSELRDWRLAVDDYLDDLKMLKPELF